MARLAGEALEQIIESVGEVSDQIVAMADSARDVKRSSEQMVSTIDSVDGVAGRNVENASSMGENADDVRAAMDGVAATTEQFCRGRTGIG